MNTLLTPEQVSALSDVELSVELATALFGGYHWGRGGRIFIRPDAGGPRVLSPRTDSSVAFVLEHMRQRWHDRHERRRWVIEDLGSEGWSVSVYIAVREGMEADTAFVEDGRLGRAVFECALLSVLP